MVDQHLAHERVPMHMGIEQPRNDEFSAEIEHLRTRRRGGVRGKHVANGGPLDQQCAISKRRVGDTVDNRRASDEKKRRRRLRLTRCQYGKRENSGGNTAKKNASDEHPDLPEQLAPEWIDVSIWPIGLFG